MLRSRSSSALRRVPEQPRLARTGIRVGISPHRLQPSLALPMPTRSLISSNSQTVRALSVVAISEFPLSLVLYSLSIARSLSLSPSLSLAYTPFALYLHRTRLHLLNLLSLPL